MKKALFALLGLASVACGNSKEPQVPETIAHRGFWQATEPAPHNSIAALENSITLGCFGTEFDIWLTADDIPVVFHDRKTGNGLVIQDVTYAELMEKDGLLANGEKIPTLDEFLAAWDKSDKKVKLIFEIKSHSTPERNSEAAVEVHKIALAHGIAPSQMEYIAFSRDVCKTLSEMNDVAVDSGSGAVIPVAYLEGDLSPAEAREQLGVTGIDYNVKVLKEHPEWISGAQALGLTVNVWTVNKEEDMQHFIAAGVDYITTDKPDVLMEMIMP
jgi:glycerophosphoryl diester phosphodiesterase